MLEAGDRLSLGDFERLYKRMRQVNKIELIEGVVHVPSPVRVMHHGYPHSNLSAFLTVYAGATPGILPADNSSVRLDLDNEPQPDAVLFVQPNRGGQCRITADDYIEGAPELVAEVASSSVSIDMNAKLNTYRRNGVREYIVWRVQNRKIDWFVLREGQYVALTPDGRGLLHSEVFPGLWLDPAALVAGDLKGVLAVLQEGIATPEHTAFVARLSSPAAPR